MLIFDTAYTYKMMVERNFLVAVTSRDLDGYFDHIWTIHPIASLFLPVEDPNRYGDPVIHKLNERHTIIEGKIGRTKKLSWIPPLNFVLAQIHLYYWLKDLSKKHNVDFVRAEDPIYNGIFAYLLSRSLRRPLLIGVWGNPGAIRKSTGRPLMPRFFKWVWLEEAVEKFILRRAKCVMVQNEDNRKFVLSTGVRHENTAIFRLGTIIDAAHFSDPAGREDASADFAALGITSEKTLICISRIEPLKLIDDVVKVTAILKKRGWPVKTLIVGDGSIRNQMVELAKELDVENEVIFCGNRDQKWLLRMIPRMSAVLSPLTGRALAEAALGKIPVVAYDIDWHGELIESGVTGELVPYKDYEKMADATEKIFKDPAYAELVARNVRDRVKEMMDPQMNMQMQRDTYENLLTPKN